jgi:tRNA(fMet)-specific endonuclease VapC
MDEALIDTDILSEILKGKDPHVTAAAQQYLAAHERFAFSAMTLYEIIRGMVANRASRQLAAFCAMADTSEVVPITNPVLRRAADLWADARSGGHPREDADLIIAATALETRRLLVTGNSPHFSWIPGLRLADWRSPTG